MSCVPWVLIPVHAIAPSPQDVSSSLNGDGVHLRSPDGQNAPDPPNAIFKKLLAIAMRLPSRWVLVPVFIACTDPRSGICEKFADGT